MRGALAAIYGPELRKALSPRRLWWVLLLALAPCLLFTLYVVQTGIQAQRRVEWASAGGRRLTPHDFQGVTFMGMKQAELTARLGAPARQYEFRRRRRESNDTIRIVHMRALDYSDGASLHQFLLTDGVVTQAEVRRPPGPGNVDQLFASVFEFFFLRLAVFFGCLGIFMNLFRAEMLNKSLHYYFLAPVRREVVMAGKFLAGLTVAMFVFVGSAVVQMLLMARYDTPAALFPHFWAYLGITALACLGYGAVFLACGLLFRNPIVPAIVLLLWEGMVPFLPAVPQKLSVIYYLMQLCPFHPDAAPGTNPILALFVSPPTALSPAVAVAGVVVVAGVVLALSGRLVRRLEIDYTSE